MDYADVCTGVAPYLNYWKAMGHKCVFHSEIEEHASAVLRYHDMFTPNLGDFTKINAKKYAGKIQLLTGGTPCQDYSLAGLRAGIKGKRGSLTLSFLQLAKVIQPEWILWENVPGILSSDGGRAFGAFLGGLAELGYGFAYRVLDAQYIRVESHPFAVPQRRRRVFVVAHIRDWRRAAATLFESKSLQGYPAPGREAGKNVAGTISSRTSGGGGLGTDFDLDGGLVHGGYVPDIVSQAISSKWSKGSSGPAGDEHHNLIALPTSADTDNGDFIAFDTTQIISPTNRSKYKPGDPCHTLTAGGHPVIARVDGTYVRRLTPLECERLQGWEDGWTRHGIDRNARKYELSDSSRYKIIGNGWAVNAVNWIVQNMEHYSD